MPIVSNHHLISPYMDRKEFLSIVGISAAGLLYTSCVTGCKIPDTVVNAPTNVDFSLDLSAPENSSLTKDGGYLYNSGIIVARVTEGHFIAVSSACTHQGSTVVYQSGSNRFYCPSHGSAFAENGSVQQGPARSALHQYNVSLDGSTLRVYS